MAKNTGRGSRSGAVLGRVQPTSSSGDLWMRRNSSPGRFTPGACAWRVVPGHAAPAVVAADQPAAARHLQLVRRPVPPVTPVAEQDLTAEQRQALTRGLDQLIGPIRTAAGSTCREPATRGQPVLSDPPPTLQR
jgi:hypothetical protein